MERNVKPQISDRLAPDGALEAPGTALSLNAGAGNRRRRQRQTQGILIVEPDDEIALALEEALENAGFNVETVASLDEARFALNGCHFDVVAFASAIDPDQYAEFLTCLAGSPGAMRIPIMFAARQGQDQAAPAPAGTAVSSRPLVAWLEAMQAVIAERERPACA